MEYETGFFSVFGRRSGKVHVVTGSGHKPICGAPFGPYAVFNWCAHDANVGYVDCARCRDWIKRRSEKPNIAA